MNKALLIGRVGKNPDIKHFDNGQIASFSLATTSRWKSKEGEKKERTEWHNIIVNGKLAEIAEKYIVKGMLLSIEGEIRYRSYEPPQGEKKYITEIFATGFEMLSKSENGEASQKHSDNPETAQVVPNSFVPDDDMPDDLPF